MFSDRISFVKKTIYILFTSFCFSEKSEHILIYNQSVGKIIIGLFDFIDTGCLTLLGHPVYVYIILEDDFHIGERAYKSI